MEIEEHRAGDVLVVTATSDHEQDIAPLTDYLRQMDVPRGLELVLQYRGRCARLSILGAAAAMLAVARLKPLDGKVVVVCDNPQIALLMSCRDTPHMFRSLEEALEFLGQPQDEGQHA
jgi:hypothetical protein